MAILIQSYPAVQTSHPTYCRSTLLESLVDSAILPPAATPGLEAVLPLAEAAEARHWGYARHVLRVGLYSYLLALALEVPRDRCNDILAAATLHDVGKTLIRTEILQKQGPLSRDERAAMQDHCEFGQKMLTGPLETVFERCRCSDGKALERLRQMPHVLALASTIALSHHERWDGCGYPLGLAGRAIPLEGRIVAVADVYDALRSKRPYKRSFSHEHASTMLDEGQGTHFDPLVYSAFCEVADKILHVSIALAD